MSCGSTKGPSVEPDYTSLYMQDWGGKGTGNRVSKFGQPEFYYVSSIYGSFIVHESRCLVFRNGVLPEQHHKRHLPVLG